MNHDKLKKTIVIDYIHDLPFILLSCENQRSTRNTLMHIMIVHMKRDQIHERRYNRHMFIIILKQKC